MKNIIFLVSLFMFFGCEEVIEIEVPSSEPKLIIDAILLLLFFGLIIYETYKILVKRKKKKLGSEVNLKYILFNK